MRLLNLLHVPDLLNRHPDRAAPQQIQQLPRVRQVTSRVARDAVERGALRAEHVEVVRQQLGHRGRGAALGLAAPGPARRQAALVVAVPDQEPSGGQDGEALVEALVPERVEDDVRAAQGPHLGLPRLVAVRERGAAALPHRGVVARARGPVDGRAPQQAERHEPGAHAAAHPVHEHPLPLADLRRVLHHPVRGVPVQDQRRRLRDVDAGGNLDAVLFRLVDDGRLAVVLRHHGDGVARLEALRAPLADGADGPRQAVAGRQGRFALEGVGALAHADVGAAEAGVESGYLEVPLWRRRADVVDDAEDGDVAEGGDEDFADGCHDGGFGGLGWENRWEIR